MFIFLKIHCYVVLTIITKNASTSLDTILDIGKQHVKKHCLIYCQLPGAPEKIQCKLNMLMFPATRVSL